MLRILIISIISRYNSFSYFKAKFALLIIIFSKKKISFHNPKNPKMNQEQLIQTIHNILSSDNALRKQSEETLNSFKKASPNDFLFFLLNLLQSKYLKYFKSLSYSKQKKRSRERYP